MKRLSDCLESQVNINLKDIKYTPLRDISEPCNPIVSDNIEAIKIEGNEIIVTVSRTVEFEQEALFRIVITHETTFTLSDDKKDNFSEIEITEAILADKPLYGGTAMNRASFLISAITSAYGGSPLVTNPNFIDEA